MIFPAAEEPDCTASFAAPLQATGFPATLGRHA